jgi:crossover junction endodeoxyribonuclease RuvC
MRVLGVDPGLTRCGLGVVEGAAGRPLTLVRTDVARTSADLAIGDRLLAIEQQIEAWLDEFRPDAVAVERVFSQHNVSTVMGTAQAAGVAIVCAARRAIPVALHTPTEVKAAVTGSGRADKAQVTAMVVRLLRLSDPPRPADAADALALAICHIWRGAAQARLAAAQAAARTGARPATRRPASWPVGTRPAGSGAAARGAAGRAGGGAVGGGAAGGGAAGGSAVAGPFLAGSMRRRPGGGGAAGSGPAAGAGPAGGLGSPGPAGGRAAVARPAAGAGPVAGGGPAAGGGQAAGGGTAGGPGSPGPAGPGQAGGPR